jgi:hypothetical protein
LAVKVVSDGPIYHLYFAARWWKAGRLILVAAPFGENAATYFPANGDLWFTWLLASWGGDRLARVGQAPFLALAGLAAYGSARLLGASRTASLIATCWFVSSTPLLIYSFEPNVDTIFVAGYTIASYFFLRGAQGEGDGAAIAVGSLAAGCALGSKPVGVVFVPPLFALAIAQAVRSGLRPATKLTRTTLIVLLPVVTGGYWFARNLVLTGNPVYPLEVRLLGHTLWPGWYVPGAMRTSVYYVPISHWRALGDTLLAVMDPRLAPVWVAALCLAIVPKSWVSPESHGGLATLSLLAVLNVALYWVCIPYRTQQRFMLQALGLAVVPLAALLDRASWLRVMAAALLAFHLLTPQTWPISAREDQIPWDLTPLIPNVVGSPLPLFSRIIQVHAARDPITQFVSLALLLGLIIAAGVMTSTWAAVALPRGQRRGRLASALAASFVFVLVGWIDLSWRGLDPQLRFYPPFPDFYAGWRHFDASSGPKGCRVAYAGTNLPYYLLGDNLRNLVCYVNVDRHRDWLMHDYHREARALGDGNWPDSRPGWDRQRPRYEAWVDNLDAAGIQLLVVTRVNPAEGAHNVADREGFPIERVWADSHPDRFEPLYGGAERDPWFRLYRVWRPNARHATKVVERQG